MAPRGLLRIEDCLDADGGIVLPPGVTLISLIERNVVAVGDTVAYRYLDFTGPGDGHSVELTWKQLGVRLRAVGAHLQRIATRGERVAIVAPQGLDYVCGFFAAVKAGMIAVPLFAPELPGHAERLETALADAEPSILLSTESAVPAVEGFLDKNPHLGHPPIVVVDRVPDEAGREFSEVALDVDDISHLQYTSGATRPPAGVEITHRAVGTNLLQMILSIDLLDRNTHGVSWLPLYHDMGLSMIGFPAVYGGHSTLMAPTAFIRRPQRWIEALSAEARHGRVVTAAPNFAYEWAAQRGRPSADRGIDPTHIDLTNVVMIIGSEPVSITAIEAFNAAFAPHGLARTAIKPSYGIAEATLFVATIDPDAEASVVHLDRRALAAGRAVRVDADDPGAVAQVSCGHVARSQWAIIVDPDTDSEIPDGEVGEIWLHGNNVGRGYWRHPEETRRTFGARPASLLERGGHGTGVPAGAAWLRTGDLGVYLAGQLYVTGRLADLIVVDGELHYPHDIETTAAEASSLVRRGYLAAFTVPATGPAGDGVPDSAEQLVILAERATGTARADPRPAVEAIRSAVSARHGLPVADVRLLPAGSIPRTTSGKLARLAGRTAYLEGRLAAP